MIQQNHPVREFSGYSDKESTQKKILRDVWRKGDICFRSGDILVSDKFGYLYFKDRKGDTFRWKGENVSTAEVESVISRITGRKSVSRNCYQLLLMLQGCQTWLCMVSPCRGPRAELAWRP